MLTDVAFREYYICEVDLLLLMINKALSLQWQWKEVQSNYLILDHMTRFSFLSTSSLFSFFFFFKILNLYFPTSLSFLLLRVPSIPS